MYGHRNGSGCGHRGSGNYGQHSHMHDGPCWQYYHEDIAQEDRKEYLVEQKKYLEADLKAVEEEISGIEPAKH